MSELNNGTLSMQGAIDEAARCLLCHDAPCDAGCGAATKPSEFIFKMRFGDFKGAVRALRKNNILAASCAEVCPTCRLCAKGCSRAEIDEAIRINELQAFLAEYERENDMQVLQAPPAGDRKVAVIGSGPAGLSAAAELAMKGYRVVVYEKMPEPGGLLRYGIPGHRLSVDMLNYEIDLVKKLGVDFECNHGIETREELEGLLSGDFDAVFVATGCDSPYRLEVGKGLNGVFGWDEFLSKSKSGDLEKVVKGKRVVVIGGGSVAMDCSVAARQLGADRVYAVSLESMEELPADLDEKLRAFAECVRFKPNCRITDVLGSGGKVESVKGREIRWIKPGLYVPDNAEDIPGSEFSLPADVVVEAIGAGLSEEVQAAMAGLETGAGGRPKADEEKMSTSDPRVFVGGDLAAVGKTVAASVKDGKKAAEAIAAAFPLSKPVVPVKRAKPSLEIDFCGVRFKNPFCLSSSPVGNTAEMVARAFDAGWGGAYYKTLNLERDYEIIDPTPRLNAYHHRSQRFIGLQNIEMVSERPFKQNLIDMAWLKKRYPDRILIASIMGYSDEGWTELAKGAADAGADMLELNFSCPQMAVEGAGHKIGQQYDMLERYTRVVKQAVSIPVIAKMTPNITDMLPPALAAKRGGADAISAINTVRAITEVNLDTMAPMPTIQGRGSISGFSGPAVKPIALRFVAELAASKELSLPVSGLGGIVTWQDAVMFLLMGASNLQATTSIMQYGYRVVESMKSGLEDYLESKGLKSVDELVGKGLKLLADPSEHHQTKHVVSKVDEDLCIGCGLCHIVCHDGANQAMQFDSKKRKAEVDQERCVGCLLCKHVCPVWNCINTEEIDHPIAGGMHKEAMEFPNN